MLIELTEAENIETSNLFVFTRIPECLHLLATFWAPLCF